MINLQPVVKSLSVSCDHLVAHCTQHQCQSCGDTYGLYSVYWKGGEGGVKPFDHLRFKILSSCEAQVADVDVVSKSERKLPGIRTIRHQSAQAGDGSAPLSGPIKIQPVCHVVLVHISILKPTCILWVGEEAFVILREKLKFLSEGKIRNLGQEVDQHVWTVNPHLCKWRQFCQQFMKISFPFILLAPFEILWKWQACKAMNAPASSQVMVYILYTICIFENGSGLSKSMIL